MVNVQRFEFDKVVASAFDAGLSSAARALGQMTRSQVTHSIFHSGRHPLNDLHLIHEMYEQYNRGNRHLLTTEIFGDVTGKSYLFLRPDEYRALTHAIPGSDSNLKEEFLKELDNILSAAVITNLSNQLHKKMFGDIPIMVGEVKAKLENIVDDDFHGEAEEVYLSASYFLFEKQPEIHPLFLWVVDYNKLNAAVAQSV